MAAIETPCTRICVIHAAEGLCLGCGRSLSEIEKWSDFTGQERTRLMADLPRRLAAVSGRRHAPAPPP